jgi:hypothetical protein
MPDISYLGPRDDMAEEAPAVYGNASDIELPDGFE